MRTAIFPGSFNPYTIGHDDICRRGLEIFDRIVVVVGYNINKSEGYDKAVERAKQIEAIYADEPRIIAKAWGGLTVDLARQLDACAILRGVRSVADFEYERTLADTNRHLSGIQTVMLFSSSELAYVSSSMVRELIAHGKDVTDYLPQLPTTKL